ncbi:MAG TPA: prepilin-type N-terminal cleavage/methylation domain-containing protein [Methylomirabilota bacterium]|nr:prepilin-type N-terminal cleavage/methylation domain-containing protein [Methylomirabilota bacterium]
MSVLSRALRDRNGFTMAELLVTCAVMGLVLGGLSMILIQGNQIYLAGSGQVEAQQAARAALQRMAQDVQAAGYDPQGLAGQAPLACAWNPVVGASPGFGVPTATSLTIQNDNDANGCIQAAERVWYNLSGRDLQRQDFSVDAVPQTIIGGVQALAFTYLDIDGNATANTALIRAVDITLTTQPERVASIWQAGRVSVTVRDRIRLRNR